MRRSDIRNVERPPEAANSDRKLYHRINVFTKSKQSRVSCPCSYIRDILPARGNLVSVRESTRQPSAVQRPMANSNAGRKADADDDDDCTPDGSMTSSSCTVANLSGSRTYEQLHDDYEDVCTAMANLSIRSLNMFWVEQ